MPNMLAEKLVTSSSPQVLDLQIQQRQNKNSDPVYDLHFLHHRGRNLWQ